MKASAAALSPLVVALAAGCVEMRRPHEGDLEVLRAPAALRLREPELVDLLGYGPDPRLSLTLTALRAAGIVVCADPDAARPILERYARHDLLRAATLQGACRNGSFLVRLEDESAPDTAARHGHAIATIRTTGGVELAARGRFHVQISDERERLAVMLRIAAIGHLELEFNRPRAGSAAVLSCFRFEPEVFAAAAGVSEADTRVFVPLENSTGAALYGWITSLEIDRLVSAAAVLQDDVTPPRSFEERSLRQALAAITPFEMLVLETPPPLTAPLPPRGSEEVKLLRAAVREFGPDSFVRLSLLQSSVPGVEAARDVILLGVSRSEAFLMLPPPDPARFPLHEGDLRGLECLDEAAQLYRLPLPEFRHRLVDFRR